MHTLAEYRSAAEILFPVRGGWSYDNWQEINARFFADSLRHGPIIWGLTAGCNFGSFNPNNGAITLHEALPGTDFAKAARERGESDWVMANRGKSFTSWGLPSTAFGIGTALGTLLHEAMHQAHHQQGLRYPMGRKGLEAHHNQVWVAECERVAKMIGLPDRIWPIYVERKETADEVRQRLGAEADHLTGKQLNNKRAWIWEPTVDGEPIELIGSVHGPTTLAGQLVADTGEITGFPRESFNRHGIGPAERVAMILPSAPSLPAAPAPSKVPSQADREHVAGHAKTTAQNRRGRSKLPTRAEAEALGDNLATALESLAAKLKNPRKRWACQGPERELLADWMEPLLVRAVNQQRQAAEDGDGGDEAAAEAQAYRAVGEWLGLPLPTNALIPWR